jgi:hypothetical protein
VRYVSDVGQKEVHAAEPLVPNPSPFEFEIAIAKLKRYKLLSSDQILVDFVQASVETLVSEIVNSLILFEINNSWW